jgi:hypothetical protein
LARAIDYASADFTSARLTALGRARLALVAALGDYSGWVAGPRPPLDPRALLRGQLSALLDTIEAMLARRASAARAIGASPVGNENTNYFAEYTRSIYRDEVRALYSAAGSTSAVDLARLQAGSRIAGSKAGSDWMHRNYAFSGDLRRPLLAIDGIGDDWLTPAQLAYAEKIARRRANSMHRQLWVARPGHCSFTAAEESTALDTLATRITTGHWPDTRPAALNRHASEIRFTHFNPPLFPRSQ